MCLNNLVSPVRVPVGVFYLNMSKKGKKQDGKYYWNDLSLSIRNKSSKILFKKAFILNIFIFKVARLDFFRAIPPKFEP